MNKYKKVSKEEVLEMFYDLQTKFWKAGCWKDGFSVEFLRNNFIPVQKVKDKIEEYKNILKTCNKAKDIDRIKAINERILELEELLEGRK